MKLRALMGRGVVVAASMVVIVPSALAGGGGVGCSCTGISKCVASGSTTGPNCTGTDQCACCETAPAAATCDCRTFDPLKPPAGTSCFDV